MKRSAMIVPAFFVVFIGLTEGIPAQTGSPAGKSFAAPGAVPVKLSGSFNFTEGPVADSGGNVYFSDYRNDRICMWSVDSSLSVFLENAGGPVGLDIDRDGFIIAASTNRRAILSIDIKTKKVVVLADRYDGKPLNSPNDLWCDGKGGIYFTDPRFVKLPDPVEQDVEGVYYLSPDRKRLVRVIDDLDKPNGVTGSPDGAVLYVDDTAVDKTYAYTIASDGSLSGKRLFAPSGYDGLTVDAVGNVYVTSRGIDIFSPSGEHLDHIDVPQRPTNLCFSGRNMETLFITTIPAAFTFSMRVRGLRR